MTSVTFSDTSIASAFSGYIKDSSENIINVSNDNITYTTSSDIIISNFADEDYSDFNINGQLIIKSGTAVNIIDGTTKITINSNTVVNIDLANSSGSALVDNPQTLYKIYGTKNGYISTDENYDYYVIGNTLNASQINDSYTSVFISNNLLRVLKNDEFITSSPITIKENNILENSGIITSTNYIYNSGIIRNYGTITTANDDDLYIINYSNSDELKDLNKLGNISNVQNNLQKIFDVSVDINQNYTNIIDKYITTVIEKITENYNSTIEQLTSVQSSLNTEINQNQTLIGSSDDDNSALTLFGKIAEINEIVDNITSSLTGDNGVTTTLATIINNISSQTTTLKKDINDAVDSINTVIGTSSDDNTAGTLFGTVNNTNTTLSENGDIYTKVDNTNTTLSENGDIYTKVDNVNKIIGTNSDTTDATVMGYLNLIYNGIAELLDQYYDSIQSGI